MDSNPSVYYGHSGVMKLSPRNLGASIKAKLLRLSRESGRTNESFLNQYFYERFLYRLGESAYRDSFLLKGGMLLIAYDSSDRLRPTRDIDFSVVALPLSEQAVEMALTEILADKKHEDGVHFLIDTIRIQQIIDEVERPTLRVSLRAMIEGTNTRSDLRFDIASGDTIVPEPRELTYPTLLESEPPRIMVYPKESVVAEKLQALVKRGVTNSRMKDFYDIVHIAQCHQFSSEDLRLAVDSTFANRSTEVPKEFSEFCHILAQDSAMNTRWDSFTKRHNTVTQNDFRSTVGQIEEFLEPILSGSIWDCVWNSELWKWESRRT